MEEHVILIQARLNNRDTLHPSHDRHDGFGIQAAVRIC